MVTFEEIAKRARTRLAGYDDGKPGTPQDISDLIDILDADIWSYARANSRLHAKFHG